MAAYILLKISVLLVITGVSLLDKRAKELREEDRHEFLYPTPFLRECAVRSAIKARPYWISNPIRIYTVSISNLNRLGTREAERLSLHAFKTSTTRIPIAHAL
jgi:hypothetical protein